MGHHHNPLPTIQPCSICGSPDYSIENWGDMNKIITCQTCGSNIWADTWRESILAWNSGDIQQKRKVL
jgi:hypothetical protein